MLSSCYVLRPQRYFATGRRGLYSDPLLTLFRTVAMTLTLTDDDEM